MCVSPQVLRGATVTYTSTSFHERVEDGRVDEVEEEADELRANVGMDMGV